MSEKNPVDMDIEEMRAEYLKFFPQATPEAIAEQGEKFDEAELKAMKDRLQKKDVDIYAKCEERTQSFKERAPTSARLWAEATPPIDLPGAAFFVNLVARESGKLAAAAWGMTSATPGVDIGNIHAYRLECSSEDMVVHGEVLRFAWSVVEADENGRPHLVPIDPPRYVRDRVVVRGIVLDYK